MLVRINISESVLFEIKYYKNSSHIPQQINDMTQTLSSSVKSYQDINFQYDSYGIGLIILEDKNAKSSREILEMNIEEKIHDKVIRFLLFTKNEFDNLNCTELRSIISNTLNSKNNQNDSNSN